MLSLKKNVLKVFLIMSVIIALLVPVASYATDDSVNVITPGTSTPTPAATASPKATATPKTTASPKVTPTPNSQSNLPQTGIEDYTGLIVVTIILGASAVFAYKKIKDYNRL